MSARTSDLRDVSAWIRDSRQMLLDLAMDVMSREVPDYFAALDETLTQYARDATEMNLMEIARGLDQGLELSDTPAAALGEARAAAQNNVAWVPFQRCYSVALAAWWERAYDEVITWDLPAERLHDLIRVVSRFLFDYFDHHLSALEKVYSQERERTARLHQRRRVALVRQVLDGLPIQEDELGYPLSGEHLAFIAWGREPDRVAPAVGAALQGQAITIPGTASAVWGWICAPRIGGAQRFLMQATSVKLPPETFLSLGQPGQGADGFRRSHREAVRAFRIGATIGQTITVYSEVQLEALALADERFAIDFTETELRTLAGQDARSRVLRDTLRAYFKTGHNGAAAAASLGVHERTVSYRLTTIEKVLGHTVIARRDELGVALRIHALLERRRDAAQAL